MVLMHSPNVLQKSPESKQNGCRRKGSILGLCQTYCIRCVCEAQRSAFNYSADLYSH